MPVAHVLPQKLLRGQPISTLECRPSLPRKRPRRHGYNKLYKAYQHQELTEDPPRPLDSTSNLTTHRALSLRNLVSGYECGRVFPAGVGPSSPSRDAVHWLPSRFSLSVETQRRYGWSRMVFLGARLFRAPIWCSSGGVAARERQGALSRRAW